MPDYTYHFNYYPREDAARVARSAVLYRLVEVNKELELDQKAFAAGQKLLTHWRARLSALRDAGWDKLAGNRIQYARNCWPGGMLGLTAQGGAACCHYHNLCPWCCARRVIDMFNRVLKGSRALAQEEGKKAEDYRLVSAYSALTLPPDAPIEEMNWHAQREIVFLRHLAHEQRASCPGSYVAVVIHPDLSEIQKPQEPQVDEGDLLSYLTDGFIVSSRLLFLVRGNAKLSWLPPSWKVRDGSGMDDLHQPDWPVARHVRTHVGRVCKYPRPLMWSAPADTIKALEAREGLRLMEFGGVFRRYAEEAAGEEEQVIVTE